MYTQSGVTSAVAEYTVISLLNEFLKYLQTMNYSLGTIKKYNSNLLMFFNFYKVTKKKIDYFVDLIYFMADFKRVTTGLTVSLKPPGPAFPLLKLMLTVHIELESSY